MSQDSKEVPEELITKDGMNKVDDTFSKAWHGHKGVLGEAWQQNLQKNLSANV